MSTISTGVGLVSGLPTQQIVESLIASQRQPITLLQDRVSALNARRTALLQVSAQLLALKNTTTRFSTAELFRTTKAASTQESVLLASATAGAAVGSYSFTVKSLATAHQVISGGFATSNATPVGAGTLTFETAIATVNRTTPLGALRGGEGVRGGKIRVTDRTGASAVIDLTTATTLDDLLGAINKQTTVNVRAEVRGDRVAIVDQTGLLTGSLTVADVDGGRTAQDLGLAGTSAIGMLEGVDLVRLSQHTRLEQLNDGNGVRRLRNQPDFSVTLADGGTLTFELSERLADATRLSNLNGGAGVPAGSIKITNRAGVSQEVDLSAAQTIGDVKSAIQAAGLNITVTLSGARLLLRDNSTPDSTPEDNALRVEEVGGGTTAAALGIKAISATGSINGKNIYSISTVGDVLRLINSDAANGGRLHASISASGTGLTLTDTSGGAGTLTVAALGGSKALDDLGLTTPASGNAIQSRRLVASLDSVLLRSLRGGAGVAGGQIQITDRAGASATVDLSAAQTLSEVIDAINAASTGVRAGVTSNGLGIQLYDTSGGAGNLVVADVVGSLATDLGLAVNAAVPSVSSGNLQRQYVSDASLLTALNYGKGIPSGKFRITDSAGASAVVDLTQGNEVTLADLIDEINSRGIGVVARVNDTGDGLLLTDTAGGAGSLKVVDESGAAAKALRIAGTAASGQTFIDGSYETRITVTGNDTLSDVLAKIQASGGPANASILNDGASGQPFRLSLTASSLGRDAALAIDSGTTGLSFETLVRGQNSTVLFGPPGALNPIVLSSASNTLGAAVAGVKLDLVSPSDQAVTVNVTRDTSAVLKEFQTFVASFNKVMSTIDSLTRFDVETEQRQALTGDPTARRVRERLIALANRVTPGGGAVNRLASIGIRIGAGSQLTLDEDKFRDAMENNPAQVEAFFTDTVVGYGKAINDELDRLSKSETGLIAVQGGAIENSVKLLTDRIASMETLLGRRRERLYAQFTAMENAIAQLQSQQRSLSGLLSLS